MSRERKLPAVPAISSKVPREIAQVLGPLKQIVEALQQGGVMSPGSNAAGGGMTGGTALPDTVIDTLLNATIPPAPTGVAVHGGMALIIVEFDRPAYRNHAYTEVWRADSDDFSQAVMVGTTQSYVYSDSVGGSRVAWYWLRHVSSSTPPRYGPFNSQTGTRGETGMDAAYLQQLLAGKITENQLALNSVNIGHIIAGAIDITKFASDIRPPRVVSALPLLPAAGWKNGDTAVLTTDGKLYRIVNGVWRKDIDAADIAGQISNAQIAGLSASKVTGQLTDAQIAAVAAAKLTGQITAAQIADGSVSGTKFASGIEPVGIVTAASLPTVKSTSTIFWNGQLYRWNGSAYVKEVNAADITGQVQAAQVAGIEAGKVTGQLSDAQIAAVAAAKLTGQITSAQIADGSVSGTKFASGLQPVGMVSTLPAVSGYTGPRVVLLTTDNKLYRYTGSAWVSTLATTDLSGTLADAQIAGLAASKVTGQLTDAQIAAVAAAKLTGQLVGAQLADGAITAAKIAAGVIDQSKLAADMEVPKQVSTLPTTYQGTDLVVLTTDRKLYRWNGTAYVSTTAAADITGQLAASQVAALEASKITGQLADAQIAAVAAAKLSGQITAPQIANGAVSPSKMLAVPEGFALNLDPGFVDPAAWRSHYNDDITGGFITVADGKRGNRVYRHDTGRDWNYNRQPIPVVIGEVYRFSAWMRKSPDATSPFYFVWAKYNADGVYQTYSHSSRVVGTEWTYVEMLLTADAPFIAPGFALNHNGTAGYGEIQDFRFEAQLSSGLVADGAILATKIADNAITTPKLAAGAVVAGKIAAGAISASEIAAGAITTAKLAAGAVTANEIAAGAITATKIAAATITGGHIAADAITAAQIAASTITATELATGAVTTAKLAAGAIDAMSIAAGAVVADKIAASAITADKLAANAVVAGKIAAGAISASEIAANAITTEKLLVAAGNLVPNSDFATGDFTNWRPWAGIANMAVLPATDPSVPPGAPTRYVARFTLSASAVSAFTHVRAYSDAGADTDGIAVCPGEAYRVAISAARDEATVGAALQVIVYYRRADGSVGNNTQMIPTQALSSEWQTFSGWFTVPANCVRAFLYVYNIGAADKSGPVFWTHLRCTRMSNADLIVDGAVTAAKIQAGAVTTAKLAAGAVTANEIAAAAVVAGKIAAGAVTATELAAGAVTTAKLAAGSVDALSIAAGAVVADKIAASAITADKLAANAVVAGKIAAGAISASEVAAGAITTGHIAAGQVTTAKLAAGAVTANEIAAGAVVAGKIAAGAVTATELAAGAVTTAKLAAGSVDALSIAAGAVVADKIAASAITADKLAANAVVAGKIAAGAISASEVAAGAITTGHIAAGQVTTAKLAAGAVTANEIAAGAVVAGKIAAGAVTATELAAGAVTTAKLAAGSVQALNIAAGAVVADKIAANAITADKLAANAVVAGKIAAGAVGASEIAAGAISAQKLAVLPNPMTITSDPSLQDVSDWTIPAPAAVVSVSELPIGNKAIRAGNARSDVLSRMVPIDRTKTYRASAWAISANASNKAVYLVVAFYDTTGALISQQGIGWSAVGIYNYFGLVNQVPAPSWTEYFITFGTSAEATIPAGARFARIGALINYNAGATGDSWVGGLRIQQVADADLIVDGAIVTRKLAAGAITSQKIAAGAVTANELAAGSVIASKIASLAVQAQHIQAGAIVADKLAAGAVTAVSIKAGEIQTGHFAPQSVTAEKIAAGSISADKLAVGSLSAVSANLGTVVAGRAQNFDGSNFVDFNAAGQMPFLKIGGNVSILANGEGYFSRRIISEPDIVASGVWSGNSGWVYPNSVGVIVIDTGMNTPGTWSDFPASVYEAAATISAGQQQGGGGTGYNYCRIVTGDGISSGGGGGYIDNRIYVLFLYFHFGAGPVLIEQIKWKVARI